MTVTVLGICQPTLIIVHGSTVKNQMTVYGFTVIDSFFFPRGRSEEILEYLPQLELEQDVICHIVSLEEM